MKLNGRAALVTGGGTGLGRAIATALAERGCAVAVNYSRSADDAEETASALRGLGVDAFAVQADVGDEARVRAMVGEAVDRFGRLDVVVNNAGHTRSIPMEDLDAVTAEDWERTLGVNTIAPFLLARAAAEHLRRNRGAIVNVGSMAGLQPKGSSLTYCVSKAAQHHLTRCLAVALAPEVRVNAVAPGFMETRWTEALADRTEEFTGDALLKRAVPVADVASAVVELLTNDSLTGQTVVVDAGTVLR